MTHKSKTYKRKVNVPQINTPTLDELKEKLIKLQGCTPSCASEAHRIGRAIAKYKRRIDRLTLSIVEDEKVKEKQQNKLTQIEKEEKKKEYKRQRKKAIRGESKDGK